MTDPVELVTDIVAANGGSIVGKTRLQKIFYLLDACGLESGFEYEYHNFGPFSVDLAVAADDAVALKKLKSDEKPGYHQVPYVEYSTSRPMPSDIGDLPEDKLRNALAVLGEYSSIDLEIASSIHFLRHNGYADTAEKETVLRKPVKATPERLTKARKLLTALGI